MKYFTLPLSVVLLVAVMAAGGRTAEPRLMSFTVGKIEREAIVFAPASQPETGSPLVFVFHGHGGNMRAAARNMKLQESWPEAIVVYMQGLPTPTKVDPEGKRPGWQHLPGDKEDRDLKFFDAVLERMRSKYKVDENRIYATGFSNGAFFSYLLWDQRSDVFAAFAPCSGLPRRELKLAVPKSAIIIAGKADKIVPIADEEAAIKRIRELDGATADGTNGPDDTTTYESKNGLAVTTFIHPAAHVVPPEAARLIVSFFKTHPKKI